MEVAIEPDHCGAYQVLLLNPRTREWRDDDFKWQSIIHIKWCDKRLAFFITTHSDIEDRQSSEGDKWTLRLLDAAIGAVKSGKLSAFTENDVTRYLRDNPKVKNVPQTISVSDEFAQQLEQEFDLDQKARQSFEHIVDKVRSAVDYLPHGASDIGSSLYMIECMLKCGHLGYEYGWYQEKMSGIRSYVSDLARRKNRRQEGFQSGLDYIRSNLFSFSAPIAWIQRPPVISAAELNQHEMV